VLDPRRLRTLHAVITTGSIKDAAAQLGYSPSAVSQQIAALQRGTQSLLLEPAGRGIRVTEAGLLLDQHAASILERITRAEGELAALNAGRLGTLRLASFATAGAELVPPALSRVRAALPELRITLRSSEREDALALLRRGMIDVGVIESHRAPAGHTDDGLIYLPLLTDPFRLLLPRGHQLATRRRISLDELNAESWIDLRCEFGCCRAMTSAAFERAGFTPNWVAEADEYWPAQGFVAAGLGLALVPALALGITHADIVVRRLDPFNEPSREVLAVTRAASTTSTAVDAMLEALSTAAANQPHPADLDHPDRDQPEE
jgi:DNA-binding transcriptional LysR family regulator